MTGTDTTSAGQKRACLWLVGGLLAIHMITMLIMVRLSPFTSDENHYLAAGMALHSELAWEPRHTILQGPIMYYCNQLTSWFGAEFDFPYDITERNKVNGRTGMLVFTMITLLLLLRITWSALGPRACVAAGLIYVMNPLVLANGCLMTADMALTAGFTLVIWATIRYIDDPDPRAAVFLGACLGVAMATKYLALLLVPAVFVAVVLGLLYRGSRELIKPTLLHGLVCVFAALVFLHASYLFHAGPYDPEATPPSLGGILHSPVISNLARVLPAPFVRGIDYQMMQGRTIDMTKFLGEITDGHPMYYVVALATKLPLALLVLLGISAVSHGSKYRVPPGTALVMAPAVVILLAYLSVGTKLQIGVRYALPILPVLILFAVRPVDYYWKSGGKRRAVLVGLALWMGVFFCQHWPRYLCAFNPLAGERPYLLFGDSTLDWQLDSSTDPALIELQTRYPGAHRVTNASGPRLGRVLFYSLDAWPRYNPAHGPVKHWLSDFDPVDHLGPYYYFVITEDHFRLALARRSGEKAERLRRNLAIALLGAGEYIEVEQLLGQGSDMPLVRKMLTILKTPNPDPRLIISGWNMLGRYDRVLASPFATPGDIGHAHFAREDYVRCRKVLEAEMQHRRLSVTEVLDLCNAQVRSRSVKKAIETCRRHAPLDESPHFAAYVSHLQGLWGEYEALMEQIDGRIPD